MRDIIETLTKQVGDMLIGIRRATRTTRGSQETSVDGAVSVVTYYTTQGHNFWIYFI